MFSLLPFLLFNTAALTHCSVLFQIDDASCGLCVLIGVGRDVAVLG
jgi:hypothetical protein